MENTKNISYKTKAIKKPTIQNNEPSIFKKRLWTTNFVNHYYNRRTFTQPVKDIILEPDSDDEVNDESIYDEY